MSMCNITFEVPNLSTFLFEESSEKNIFTIIFVRFWLEHYWPSLADDGLKLVHNWANVSCYLVSGLSGHKVSPI